MDFLFNLPERQTRRCMEEPELQEAMISEAGGVFEVFGWSEDCLTIRTREILEASLCKGSATAVARPVSFRDHLQCASASVGSLRDMAERKTSIFSAVLMTRAGTIHELVMRRIINYQSFEDDYFSRDEDGNFKVTEISQALEQIKTMVTQRWEICNQFTSHRGLDQSSLIHLSVIKLYLWSAINALRVCENYYFENTIGYKEGNKRRFQQQELRLAADAWLAMDEHLVTCRTHISYRTRLEDPDLEKKSIKKFEKNREKFERGIVQSWTIFKEVYTLLQDQFPEDEVSKKANFTPLLSAPRNVNSILQFMARADALERGFIARNFNSTGSFRIFRVIALRALQRQSEVYERFKGGGFVVSDEYRCFQKMVTAAGLKKRRPMSQEPKGAVVVTVKKSKQGTSDND